MHRATRNSTGRRTWRRTILIASITVLGFAGASVGAADSEAAGDAAANSEAKAWVEQLWKAIGLHNRARTGQKGAAKDAVALLKDLLKEQSEHSIAMAYLGSSYIILARDTSNATRRERYFNNGLRQLDRAMKLTPENFVVLTVSANVNMRLPSAFGRTGKARDNALALDAIYASDPDPRQAMHMVPVYGYLHQQAVEAGDTQAAEAWSRKQSQAQQQAASVRTGN